MLLEPSDLFERLEFDKILHLIEKECLGELGIEQIRAIRPSTKLEEIDLQLKQVNEYKISIEERDDPNMGNYHDIGEDLRLLAVPDYVLAEESFKNIHQILSLAKDLFQFFNANRQKAYPSLFQIIAGINFDVEILTAIRLVIDEEGNIRPDASPALLSLRRAIQSKQRELDRVFRTLIGEYKNKGWLGDTSESYRNGRRVLTVPSEHKRKIRGIIHDESATGRTAYIEPEPIIDINNDIFDLETEERKEIYRILKELSATIRPYGPLIHIYMGLLVRFDVIRAKAKLATRLKANMPELKNGTNLGIVNGRHPLLYLKNSPLGRKTVPFTLTLFGPNRLLVLSGPNAGGKSITMKSVGLLQLMVQSGMLIPVDAHSEMGIFQNIFADIGDQQSIEDDLSTYSSRLINMKKFLDHADAQTLVLIDEFGSGTDPKVGGAIAEAILREFNYQKVFGVITTHYSNLKIFAFKNKGLVNGAMHFDRDTLSPTYELKVGRPGSSYGFEIAEKSGLAKPLLDFARHRTGKNEYAVDELLVDLQREKQEVEEQLRTMAEREKNLEKLIKNYEQLHKDLEYRRKKLKLEIKEQSLSSAAQDNKEMERLMREIREEKNLEKAKLLAEQVKQEKQKAMEEVQSLRHEIYQQPVDKKAATREIIAGDPVKLLNGGATGIVASIDKKKAVVMVGDMRMTLHTRDLQLLSKDILEVKPNKSINTEEVEAAAGFQNKIDIRGMRMDEALRVVELFVDKAIIADAAKLRILHGKGNGVLKKAVKSKLKEYNIPMNIRHPAEDQGGDGVTIVEF